MKILFDIHGKQMEQIHNSMNPLDNALKFDEVCKRHGIVPAKLSVEEREELRDLLTNYKKPWAHKKLIQEWGIPCDSDTDGCNQTGNGVEREARHRE